MINPFQVMNPVINQQLQSRMQSMMKQNPQAFQKMQEMVGGKSEAEIKQTALNLAKERGVDLNAFAKSFGIQL